MVGLSFWIEGKPEPQGSKTAGIRTDGSAFLRDKNPRALKDWRKAMTTGFVSQRPDFMTEPITVGIMVRATFWMPRPKSAPKTRDVRPTVRPDGDKLLRAVMDSLTTSRLIKDDALAYDLHAVKRYAIDPVALPKIYVPGFHREVPGVEVVVAWLSE